MKLVDQHTKLIMEGCKDRARDEGLRFEDETLEYIVTNRDLLELSPKMMIPTLYDYWVHDVEVLKEKGKYELYPTNPYETVINTRPAISFYNDNNPDWLNVMIFYHVLAHIDFFQNNIFFRNTWDYDFTGQALSDKRLIAKLRAEKGRWVDYVIEFSRGADNLVAYHKELSDISRAHNEILSKKVDFYFDIFIQKHKIFRITDYIKEIERYNKCMNELGENGETQFFSEIETRFPEFEALYAKHLKEKTRPTNDLLQFLIGNSQVLRKEENEWMKSVMQVVRNTSLFFQPQIRTKIMNEGWASYWHEKLFIQDDRIKGHEINFARVNAGVTSMPKIGLNPYALGMRLFSYMEELADKGKYSIKFRQLSDSHQRKEFNAQTGLGKNFIFNVRENFSDFTFINTFVDQDFINSHKLFVVGKRLNQKRMVWEFYVKSRKAEDYRQMLFDALYHPPHVEIKMEKSKDDSLYLYHHFEGRPLVTDYIPNTLMGIEYLWGAPVQLETSEIVKNSPSQGAVFPHAAMYSMDQEPETTETRWQRVVYTMKDRKITRKVI